jgi:hypothetical protein
MQSLEHRALAQTARTQFKERQQSMARFHPSHRLLGTAYSEVTSCLTTQNWLTPSGEISTDISASVCRFDPSTSLRSGRDDKGER